MEGKKCIGVVVENLNGRKFYEAGAVVDATGNACIMDRTGVSTVNGRSFMFNTIDGETYPDAIGWCGDFRPLVEFHDIAIVK